MQVVYLWQPSRMLDEFLDLFLPTKCLQCLRPPSVICQTCASGLDLPAHPVTRGGLNGYSVVDYSAEVSQLIDKYKEHGVTAVAKFLAKPMVTNLLANASPGAFLVVPPSSKQSVRRRGYEPATVLAAQIIRQARKAGFELKLARQALTLIEPVHDQAQLNARQRFENLANAMVGQRWLAGQQVILIDDIVTTGATLLECRRAVEEAGGFVRFFSTFAETKSKNDTQR